MSIRLPAGKETTAGFVGAALLRYPLFQYGLSNAECGSIHRRIDMAIFGKDENAGLVMSAKELDREFLPRHVAIIMDGN